MSANNFGIEFLQFTISDYATKKVIFEVGRDNPTPQDITVDFSSIGEDMYRKIKYTFSEDVLRLPLIQTSLVFSVGTKEVKSFRMIERHYFRDRVRLLCLCATCPSHHSRHPICHCCCCLCCCCLCCCCGALSTLLLLPVSCVCC